MISLTLTKNTVPTPRHPILKLQSGLLHHHLIQPLIFALLLLMRRKNIVDRITFVCIVVIMSMTSKPVLGSRKRIAPSPTRNPIPTNRRCLISTIPSLTLHYCIQYLSVPPAHLLIRKTSSLSLRGCRGSETRYPDFYVRIYFESCLSIGFYSGLLLTGDDRLWSNSQLHP